MIEINHENLKRIIPINYKLKTPMMLFGTFGIGKSYIILEEAKKIAKEKKKEFVQWDLLTKKKKQELFKNPEKYFVFMDIRLSNYEFTDMKGLMDFSKSDLDVVDWKLPLQIKFMTLPKSDGLVLFDEGNQAKEDVIEIGSEINEMIPFEEPNDPLYKEFATLIQEGNKLSKEEQEKRIGKFHEEVDKRKNSQ